VTFAMVFRSKDGQAARALKQFRLQGKELQIFGRGDESVLREKQGTMRRAFELLAGLPGDPTIAGRKNDRPQKRDGVRHTKRGRS
jgi:virulence-associated protein VagC